MYLAINIIQPTNYPTIHIPFSQFPRRKERMETYPVPIRHAHLYTYTYTVSRSVSWIECDKRDGELKGRFSTDCWRGVMGQKLLVQEAPGSGSGSANRMEGGEGAGGGELHHFLHQYNQQSHSPGQSLQGGLPLPLSPQSLRHDGSSSTGIAGVKREPEDLSSSRGAQQSSKRHKQAQPDSPTPPGMYHHHQHQLQVFCTVLISNHPLLQSPFSRDIVFEIDRWDWRRFFFFSFFFKDSSKTIVDF